MYNVGKTTRTKLYESFGKTEQTASEDVKQIHKWLQTQPHLPEIMDETMIRNMLNLCKYNMEKAKERIVNYYTYKTKYPDFFQGNNPKLPRMKEPLEVTHMCTHPKLLDGVHRVLFMKPKAPNKLNPKGLLKIFYNILEVRLQEDFMIDDVIIVDALHLTVRDLCKLTVPLVFKAFNAYKNIYSVRMNALYFLNSPTYISIVMTIFKFIMPPKIFSRVKVFKDAEILKEIFPLEDLPKDYGGDGPSLDQLDAMMKGKYEEYQSRFDLLDTLRVDESQKPMET